MGGLTKAVGNVFGSILGTNADPAPQPAPTTMPELPNADDEAVRAAKRKKAAAMQARSGRVSTILSDSGTSDKLGG